MLFTVNNKHLFTINNEIHKYNARNNNNPHPALTNLTKYNKGPLVSFIHSHFISQNSIYRSVSNGCRNSQ